MDPSRLLPLAMLAFASSGALADSIAVVPANPTPVDVVRLRYQHTGCINPDSLRITQESNRIVVSADRGSFIADECGSIAGFFEDLTIGRFPSGEYDAQLVVNPPPGTLGPSFLVGPIHFTVASMPPTGSLLPHEDYSDLWWNPAESGWALLVKQSGAQLFAVWVTYDAAGRPTWYSLQPGAWRRDSTNTLRYSGTVYRTTGPYWGGAFDPKAVTITAAGTADFAPSFAGRVLFTYTIDGVSGSKTLQRMQF